MDSSWDWSRFGSSAGRKWRNCPKTKKSDYEVTRPWVSALVPHWPFFLCSMEIDLIFKIAAIGIIVSILNQVLSRSGREEQATMTTLAGLVVVLMMLTQKIAQLFDLVKTLFEF